MILDIVQLEYQQVQPHCVGNVHLSRAAPAFNSTNKFPIANTHTNLFTLVKFVKLNCDLNIDYSIIGYHTMTVAMPSRCDVKKMD